jgi:Sec-independent protein secretion pathway component TatC
MQVYEMVSIKTLVGAAILIVVAIFPYLMLAIIARLRKYILKPRKLILSLMMLYSLVFIMCGGMMAMFFGPDRVWEYFFNTKMPDSFFQAVQFISVISLLTGLVMNFKKLGYKMSDFPPEPGFFQRR